jgi:tetratricopeptide (TPR) repeat protein
VEPSFVLDSAYSPDAATSVEQSVQQPGPARGVQAENKLLRAQENPNAVMRSGQELVDAIQRAPRDPFLYEGFANFLEAVGDRKQAAGAYQKMLELLPHDFYSKLQLGRLRGELGDNRRGRKLCCDWRPGNAPTSPMFGPNWATSRWRKRNMSEALDSYAQGTRLRPQDPGYLCYQANALAKLNRRAEAIATYRRAIQIRADLSEAHFELAGILAADNQVAESLREYAEAIRLNPGHATSRINLGVMLFRQTFWMKRSSNLKAALQLEPTNATATEYLRRVTEHRKQKQ